jgi:hypothetical protein
VHLLVRSSTHRGTHRDIVKARKVVIRIENSVFRYDVINCVIAKRFPDSCRYLEIGVRNPADCFDRIPASDKTSVDPGAEFSGNPASYKLTSDKFFEDLEAGQLALAADYKWDVVFVDGLHLAPQTFRDIENSIAHLSEKGFLLLHDCNPPDWRHAHSDYEAFRASPTWWNGTVWKALYLFRTKYALASATLDTDYGVGIISKGRACVPIEHTNTFFEFGDMKKDRKRQLGLITVEQFRSDFDAFF